MAPIAWPPWCGRGGSSERASAQAMELKARILSAVGWSLAVKLGLQIFTWAITLLVIRLLSPEDYGLMAIAQVFLNLVVGLTAMGLGDALVQRDNTPREVVARVFGWSMVAALVMAGLMVAVAHPVADWYGEPRLALLVQAAALNLPLNALATLPRAALTKALHVRKLVVVEAASNVFAAVVTFTLAWLGYGVWALMIGSLAGSTARTGALLLLAADTMVMPRLGVAGLGRMVSFGVYRALEHFVWVVQTSIDVLIVGHFLGTATAGVYAVALNFAMMPLSKIAPVLNSTAFPAFALLQARPAEARYYLIKAIRLMALAAFPVFFGVHAVAPEVVEIVFGPNWVEAKPVLAVLALASAFRAIQLPFPNYLQGTGRSRESFWCMLAGLVLIAPALAIGCSYGVIGAGVAWLVVAVLGFVLSAAIAAHWGDVVLRELLVAPLKPLLAGLAMLAVVLPLGEVLVLPEWPGVWASVARLAVLAAVGGAVFSLVLMLAFRDLRDEAWALVRRR